MSSVAALESVLRARDKRYLMANVPRGALAEVKRDAARHLRPDDRGCARWRRRSWRRTRSSTRRDIYRTIADLKTHRRDRHPGDAHREADAMSTRIAERSLALPAGQRRAELSLDERRACSSARRAQDAGGRERRARRSSPTCGARRRSAARAGAALRSRRADERRGAARRAGSGARGARPGVRAALEQAAARDRARFTRAQLPTPLEIECERGVGSAAGPSRSPRRRVRAGRPRRVSEQRAHGRRAGARRGRARSVVCSPPGPDGSPPAAVLAACCAGGCRSRVRALAARARSPRSRFGTRVRAARRQDRGAGQRVRD